MVGCIFRFARAQCGLLLAASILVLSGISPASASGFLENLMEDAEKVIKKTQEEIDKQLNKDSGDEPAAPEASEAPEAPAASDQAQPDQQPAASAPSDPANELLIVAPTPDLYSFRVQAYKGLVRLGIPDTNQWPPKTSDQKVQFEHLAGQQLYLLLLSADMVPSQFAALPDDIPSSPAGEQAAASRSVQIVASHALTAPLFKTYFCQPTQQACQQSDQATPGFFSFGKSMSKRWGGTLSNEFQRRAAYRSFREERHLENIRAWAKGMPRETSFVLSTRLGPYDFAQKGFELNFHPGGGVCGTVHSECVYKPKAAYETVFQHDDRIVEARTYLKMAEGAAQQFRDRMDAGQGANLHLVAKISFHGAHKKTTEITEFAYSLASPVIEVFEDPSLTRKAGEIHLAAGGASASAGDSLGQDSFTSTTHEVEALLARLGYEAGPADDSLDKASRKAIVAFQLDQDMAIDGQVSPALLDALRRASGAQTSSAANNTSSGVLGVETCGFLRALNDAPLSELKAQMSRASGLQGCGVNVNALNSHVAHCQVAACNGKSNTGRKTIIRQIADEVSACLGRDPSPQSDDDNAEWMSYNAAYPWPGEMGNTDSIQAHNVFTRGHCAFTVVRPGQ